MILQWKTVDLLLHLKKLLGVQTLALVGEAFLQNVATVAAE
jgi:hypothetical protein